jgi:hypothetical protein
VREGEGVMSVTQASWRLVKMKKTILSLIARALESKERTPV